MGLGKALVLAGLSLAAVGVIVLLADKLGLRPLRLPGDFVWRGKHTVVYFPLATSLILSVLLTLLLGWLSRR